MISTVVQGGQKRIGKLIVLQLIYIPQVEASPELRRVVTDERGSKVWYLNECRFVCSCIPIELHQN